MSLAQLTLSIADRIDKTSDTVNLVDEMALLFVWKYIAVEYAGLLLPRPDDVATGKMSLAEAYEQLNSGLGDRITSFASAELPVLLSDKAAQYILREIDSIHGFSNKEYVDQLFMLASRFSSPNSALVLPDELIDLMIALAGIKNNTVYSPFRHSLRLAASAAFWGNPVCFEADEQTPFVEAIAFLAGVENKKEDPFHFPSLIEHEGLRQFAGVIMAPEFGRHFKRKIPDRYHRFSERNTNGDVLAVEHALAQCSGRLVTLVPQGVLFRGANDYDLRARLIDSGWIEAVIRLPSPLLPDNHSTAAIVVIDKKRKPSKPVILYDANQASLVKSAGRGKPKILSGWETIVDVVVNDQPSPFARLVETETIKANDYDLSLGRYVLGEASAKIRNLQNTRALNEVAELIRGQLLKEDDSQSGERYVEAGIKDIGDDGFLKPPVKQLRLSGRMKDRAELQRLKPGDILLATKGSVGKLAMVGPDCGDNWVASQSFQLIRIHSSNFIARPEILFRYLSSPLVQNYFKEQMTGSSISVLKTADVNTLPVPTITLDEQHKIMQTHDKILKTIEEMRALQASVEELGQRHWKMSRQ